MSGSLYGCVQKKELALPTHVRCPNCRGEFKVSDDNTCRNHCCPSCQHLFFVTSSSREDSDEKEQLLKIDQQFNDDLELINPEFDENTWSNDDSQDVFLVEDDLLEVVLDDDDLDRRSDSQFRSRRTESAEASESRTISRPLSGRMLAALVGGGMLLLLMCVGLFIASAMVPTNESTTDTPPSEEEVLATSRPSADNDELISEPNHNSETPESRKTATSSANTPVSRKKTKLKPSGKTRSEMAESGDDAVVPEEDLPPVFVPLEEKPFVFQLPPLDPEPVPDQADKAALVREDQQIDQKLKEARSEELGIFVRFEPMEDDSIKVLINAGATPDDRTNWTMEQRLTFGHGIPLFSLDASWDVEIPAIEDRKLVQESAKGEHYRLQRMNLFAEQRSNVPSLIRKLIWSSDGNQLYVLTDLGHLLKINTRTWEITEAVRPKHRIRDITLSSAGIIALHSNSSVFRSSRLAKHWVMIESLSPQTGSFQEQRLLVIDPTTLKIKRAYRLEGTTVVGHPNRDLVYLHQNRRERLLVVNVANGELVNMVHQDSLKPRKFVNSKGASSRISPARPIFADLQLLRGGRNLLSIRDHGSGFALHRFLLTGPHVTCTESLNNLPKSKGPVIVTNDGRFLVFPVGTNQLQMVSTGDFDKSLGTVSSSLPAQPYLFEPLTKSIVIGEAPASERRNFRQLSGNEPESLQPVDPFSKPNPTEAKDYFPGDPLPPVVNLRFLQETMETRLILDGKKIVNLWAHPQGRGVLIYTNTNMYWLEPTSRGKRWPFERTFPNVLPAVAGKTKPVIPTQPISAIESRDKNRLEIPLSAIWMAWSPDGSAYYALKQRDYTMHRFDAQTHIETHRLKIPNTSNVVPRAFMTKNGILFDHKSIRKIFLLDLKTLQPIWELESKHAYWPVGHRDHGLITARYNKGVIVFEAETARVRVRASYFDIAKQWPDSCDDPVKFVFPDPDPNIVKCYRDRLATFRIEDGKLKYVDSGSRNHGPTPRFASPEPQYEPQGYTYRLRDRQGTLIVSNSEGKVVFGSNRPNRISQLAPHPTDPGRILISAGGKLHLLNIDVKTK